MDADERVEFGAVLDEWRVVGGLWGMSELFFERVR